MSDANASKLSSIKTYLLIAFVFNLLAVIGFLVGFLVLVIVIVGVAFLVPLVISFLTLRRINRMRHAAEKGDISQLKGLNSVGWAIITLLFSGVIPGILLLIANGPINELSSSQPMAAPPAASATPAPPGSKNCPSCGTQVAADTAFCPKCGAKLS